MTALALALPFSTVVDAADFYWENPKELPFGQARYPVLLSFSGTVVLLWQESETTGDTGRAWVSCATRIGPSWRVSRRVAGPATFKGEEPPLFSATAGRELVVALSRLDIAEDGTASPGTSVWVSPDAASFSPVATIRDESVSAVAPRVFSFPGGGYALFVSREGGGAGLGIGIATSPDAREWSAFRAFVDLSDGLELSSFLPSFHADSARSAVVVFQSLVIEGRRSSYQLFAKRSSDGGLTWTRARRITAFEEPGAPAGTVWDNQRPSIARAGGSLWLAWERAVPGGRPRVYACELDASLEARGAEAVSPGEGSARDPVIVDTGKGPAIAWFDNRTGADRAWIATRAGVDWKETRLSSGNARFARVLPWGRGLLAIWEAASGSTSRLYELSPDTTVSPPALRPVGFDPARRQRGSRAAFAWTMPQDSSGIMGWSWTWTRDPASVPPQTLSGLSDERTAAFAADSDGEWFFAIRAVDYAGNWSDTVRASFRRDTTPPAAPEISPPPYGPDGYAASNDISLAWAVPGALDVDGNPEAIAGYAWTLRRVAGPFFPRVPSGADETTRANAIAAAWETRLAELAPLVSAVTPAFGTPVPRAGASWTNVDDGVWVLAVAAVDEAGNAGPVSRLVFRTDKFVPYTAVSLVDRILDQDNRATLRVLGRGFATDGYVTRVVLDRDGKEPWDREAAPGSFRIASDTSIEGARFDDVETGTYRLGLYHTRRGWYFAPLPLSLEAGGTVKYGDYSSPFGPAWTRSSRGRSGAAEAAALLLVALAAAGTGLAARSFARYAGELKELRREAVALVNGEALPMTRIALRAEGLRKRGAGLRLKFALTFTLLVLFVVLVVAIPLGLFATGSQSEALATGLRERAGIVLESASIVAGNFLAVEDELGMLEVPSQTRSMADALWITVTSFEKDREASGYDFVRGSNDPDLAAKTGETQLRPGKSELKDGLSAAVARAAADLDAEADRQVGEMNATLQSIREETIELATKSDPASLARLAELSSTTRQLTEAINARLRSIADAAVFSVPEYDPVNLPPDPATYVFFKPIVFRRSGDATYFRGAVRLAVSTASIVREVGESSSLIVTYTALFALGAVALGAIASLVLSSVIIGPIKKLVDGISRIRDTEDKSELKGYEIDVRTRDEIATLAEVVNQMTDNLARAALASKDLTLGKETQKMFIPLERDSRGDKLTTGKREGPHWRFFGYYEGAKGVSGDYFDFFDLDEAGRLHAFIKCDVAGKGVPAALIMVEVATIFLAHFKDWDPNRKDYGLAKLAFTINDMLEERGFKGRFAALLLGVFDSVAGVARVCNAGDKYVNVYRAATGKVETVELPDSPTAGTFPSFMVEMRTPYREAEIRLGTGDIMLLYTDGIEEAKRYFRDESFRVVTCDVCKKEGDTHGNHSFGQDNEEFGKERVNAIVEAVMSRGTFVLRKFHDPENAEFVLDFSGCEGTVEEAVLALVSTEKLFRTYRTPNVGRDQVVRADSKIDAFLRAHFVQYRLVCSGEAAEEGAAAQGYATWPRNLEDEQYDDLTIMGIERKRD